MFYTLKGLVVKNMDKESFVALLEEAQLNEGKHFFFKNGMYLFYGWERWTLGTNGMIVAFDKYEVDRNYLRLFDKKSYYGIANIADLERVE